MLAFLFEPLRFVYAILESIVVFVGAMFVGGGHFVPPGDYMSRLNRTGIFENRAQASLPQTVVHDIVLEFFEADHGNKTPKCLLIGYDGARADALINTKDDPNAGTQLLKRGGGAVYQVYAGHGPFQYQETVTAPGWTTLLTGHWAKEGKGGHGVTANGVVKPEGTPKLIFTELLEKKLAKKTSFLVSWHGHFVNNDATYINDMAYCKTNKLNAEWITNADDDETYKKALAELKKTNGADMLMSIFEDCDHAGHGNTYGNHEPAYVEAIKQSEKRAAGLIAAVKARPGYAGEDWLILITADHGGVFTGHGPQFTECRQIFLAVNKKVF